MTKISTMVGAMITTGNVIISQDAAQRVDGTILVQVGDRQATLSQQAVADLLPDLKAFAEHPE